VNPPPTRAERQANCRHADRDLVSLYKRGARPARLFIPDAFRCTACGALLDRTPAGNPSR